MEWKGLDGGWAEDDGYCDRWIMMRFNSIITFKYLEVTRNEHTVPS